MSGAPSQGMASHALLDPASHTDPPRSLPASKSGLVAAFFAILVPEYWNNIDPVQI
jgi:hypothetical protein